MTADKLTPTHTFSRWGQASALSAHNKHGCWGAGAPTRVTPPSLSLSSFWLPIPRRQAHQEKPTHARSSSHWGSFRAGKPKGLLHGCADVTFALWIKPGSQDHLQWAFSPLAWKSHSLPSLMIYFTVTYFMLISVTSFYLLALWWSL